MSRTGSIGRFVPESDSVKILKNVVQSSYPNLNTADQNTLHKYIYFLIQYIAVCFDFYSDVNGFRTKLEQNSYKDCRWLLTYLIPYIDTETISLADIKNLSDLYTLEEPDQVKHDIPPEDSTRFPNLQSISYRSPRYVFSNIQYSRFDRRNSYKTVQYDESHIRHNFALLMKTIKDVRYKMYVNWIDIVPIRMDDYKSSRLYETTKAGLQNISDWDPLDMTMTMTNESFDKFEPDVSDAEIDSFYSKTLGLNIGDIYNTINSDLYGSIVQYKWLLFDIYTASGSSSAKRITVPILYVLRDVFGIKLMLSGTSYDELSSDDRNAFDTKFRELQSMYGSTSSTSILHPSAVDTLVNSIVLFYNQKYSKIKRKGYVPLPPNMTRSNPDDYDHNRSYDKDKTVILTTLKSMDPSSVYGFIVEALEGFGRTWFGLKLLNPDKTDVVDVSQCNYAVLESGDYVTYKNIYNFCKSIVHHTQTPQTPQTPQTRENANTYIRYPALWDAIDDVGKTDFTDRIRGTKDYRSWFNIFSNLLHPIKMYDQSIDATATATDRNIVIQINQHMSDIYNLLKTSIIDIVFETMIGKGILSTMIAKTELTNAQLYDVSDSVKKSNLVKAVTGLYFSPESPYMKHCYFYMTNTPYNKVGTHIVDIDNKKQKLNYIIAQSTISLAPYINTAYHWVAQIGFCHKFIHNRVTYITGATGAGKSTEIPKFYLYYLKSLDRIDDGTVVITVPRKNAAEKTSDYISKQLALPYNIFDFDSDSTDTTEPSIKNRSDLFYVQFKHSGDRHISSGRFPKMRFVTDGSVIDDIKDPMIRSKRVGKHGKYVYGRSDLFNILLVDEAHEHNANMDIILSMAKNAAYYNNRFRLCIVSATMAEDEPVYRRFYRDINDNRKYPLSTWLAKHSIDRINTDRRFHISPPDVGTRFSIEDIYRPAESIVSIIKEIISKSESGEILVFQPGSAEINKLVAELNNSGVTPPNTIALPYYAKMPKDKKEIIEQIHNELKNIKLSKLEDFTQKSLNAYEGSYSYTRAIIVSTNISEASITYPSLKYVVETGIEKTAVYDYKTRSNVIKPNGITEASRKQRRGRVGRNSQGTVYYTYEKDSMLMNRKQYNISVQDSHFSIFLKLIKDASDLPIFTKTVIDVMRGTYGASQVNANTVISAIKQSYGSEYSSSNSYSSKFVESIIDIITELYMPNGYYVPYAGIQYTSTSTSTMPMPITSDTRYGYPYDLYFSGYDYKQLTDVRGTFYIVHPDELVIDRNINGDVVRVIKDIELVDVSPLNPDIPAIQQKLMRSQKIRSFWLSLLDGRYCTIDQSHDRDHDRDRDRDRDQNIVKTVLGSIMEYCLSKLSKYAEFEENQDFMKMIILAYGLADTVDFNIILSAVCYTIIADLKPVNIFREELEPPSTLYGKHIQSMESLSQSTQFKSMQKQSAKAILNRTKAILNPMDPKLGHSDMSVLIKIVQIIDSLIKITNLEASQTEVTTQDVYDEKDLEARYRAISLKQEELINKQMTVLQQSSSMTILKGMGLNMYMLKRYLSLRQKMRSGILDLILNVDGFKRARTGFDKFDDIRKLFEDDRAIMSQHGIDALRASLLLSFPYSIVRKIDGTDYHYLSVYTPDLSTIYTIGSISQNYYYPNTYVNKEYLQKYVHHANLNTEAGTIDVLTEIKPEYIMLIGNVYRNKTYGTDTINTKPEAIQKYAELIKSRSTPRKNLDDLYAIDGARKAVQNIKHELTSVIGGSSTDAVSIEQILWGV